MRIGFDPFITFDPGPHTYTGMDGHNYASVSKVLSTYKEPFEAHKISYSMANGDTKVQQEILKEWDDKRNTSAQYGTIVHNLMENYFKNGTTNEGLKDVAEDINAIIKPYDKVLPEFIFHSKAHKVAGTADLPLIRRTVKREGKMFDVVDIGDYKTNVANGIRYSSTYWKEGWKHGKYMLGPLSHLENCEFNVYAMQLSLYALMAELTYDVVIGRLFLLYIPMNWRVQHIAVPYMKYEAQAVLDNYSQLKSI